MSCSCVFFFVIHGGVCFALLQEGLQTFATHLVSGATANWFCVPLIMLTVSTLCVNSSFEVHNHADPSTMNMFAT